MWSIEATGPTVNTLRINATRSKGWEQRILLTSDRHVDNPMSNQAMQKRHLDQALEHNAPVLDFGDLFCAMQGKKDRRHNKGHIRPENQEDDYYDSITRSNTAFFAPYAPVMAMLGRGNHETAIIKHNEIDLTRRLTENLQAVGSPVQLGGFRGWVRLMLKAGNVQQSFKMFWTHGAGGSAPVTKGIIGTNRRASYLDADIICSGHIHESWSLELCRAGLSDTGVEYVKDQVHLCIPTYKEEFHHEQTGFHVEREAPPKPLGAWWLRFFYDGADQRFKFDYSRAK